VGKMENNYAALIIDIKNSRELKETLRVDCQEKLIKIIEDWNYLNKKMMMQKLVFSAGDSVQGLFNNLSEALECYFFVKNLLYPYQIRCGIGYGTIYNMFSNLEEINNSNYIDGESYHRAAESLELCRKNDYEIIINSSIIEADLIVNQILHTVGMLEINQSSKQKDIFNIINILDPIVSVLPLFKEEGKLDLNKYLNKNIKHYNIVNLSLVDNIDSSRFILRDFNQKPIFIKDPIDPSIHHYVSKLLAISRESVRQTVERGQMNEIRRLQIVSVIYLKKIYGREDK
jgi:hypothetical protein